MTTRHVGYLVTLERDIREDDAERTITALRMVKGVVGVEPVVADLQSSAGEMRARVAVVHKLHDLVREILDGK